MAHRLTLTFDNPTWARIVARWGSETAYKAWVKEQTFAALTPTGYSDTFTERIS